MEESDPTILHESGPSNRSGEYIKDFLSNELDYTPARRYAYEKRFSDMRDFALAYVFKYTTGHPNPVVEYVAMTYVDRFLSRKVDIPAIEHDKGVAYNLELFSFCCVLIALRELYPYHNTADEVMNHYNLADDMEIRGLENRIREGLEHKVLPYMNAFTAVDFFIPLLLTEDEQHLLPHNTLHYLLLAFYRDIKYTEFKPTVLAGSTILALCYKLHPELHPEFSEKLFSFDYLYESKVALCFDQMIKEDAIFEDALNPPEPPPLFYRETSNPEYNRDKGKELADAPIDYGTAYEDATEEELSGYYYVESSGEIEEYGDHYAESSGQFESTEEEQVLENAPPPESFSEITASGGLQVNVAQLEGESDFTQVQENVPQMDQLSNVIVAEEEQENVAQPDGVSAFILGEQVQDNVARMEHSSDVIVAEERQENVAQPEGVSDFIVGEQVHENVPQMEYASNITVAEQGQEVSDFTQVHENVNVPQMEHSSDTTTVVQENVAQPERISDFTEEEIQEHVPVSSDTTFSDEEEEEIPVIKDYNWLPNLPVRDSESESLLKTEHAEDQRKIPIARFLCCLWPAVCKCFGYEIGTGGSN